MENIILTQAKYDEMTERLKYLETTGRSEIAQAIKSAKEFGDLSENAEYSAAKDAQVKMEYEISELIEKLKSATVIDESTISTKKVGLGTKVKILDVEFNEEMEYLIVSSAEANSMEGKISELSPVGKALIGKKKGDTVSAITPGGELQFKILSISK